MAGKARVHELAKELGKTSKEIMAKLTDMGEFVKSPSSTIEAPVVRKLRQALSRNLRTWLGALSFIQWEPVSRY